jgi:hypothetical protein
MSAAAGNRTRRIRTIAGVSVLFGSATEQNIIVRWDCNAVDYVLDSCSSV